MSTAEMTKSNLAIALLFMTFQVHAVNKCIVNGQVVFQDRPCVDALETVGQTFKRKDVEEQYYAALDRLQAGGKGIIEYRAYSPRNREIKQVENEPTYFKAQSGTRDSRSTEIVAKLTEQTVQSNAASTARLTAILEDAKARCGGSLDEQPRLGMTEERFRNCTLSTRFGNVTQVVEFRVDEKELRLFIMPNSNYKRIYMIDGVVTKMR
jgi:hypothetical protein